VSAMDWGKLAIRALRNHYAKEVRPHAEAVGIPRAEILKAAHRALEREFDRAWPASQEEKPERIRVSDSKRDA